MRILPLRANGVSMMVSVAIHALVLVKGGQALIEAPKYGVERGGGNVEVHLLAAPLTETTMAFERSAEIIDERRLQNEAVAIHKYKKKRHRRKHSKHHKAFLKTKAPSQGDGSSPVAGTAKTTAQSTKGAWTEAKPNYLRNPAPEYPRRARALGQEGLVSLVVEVDSEGSVKSVSMKKSSGYFLLDEAAMKAVRRWKFLPAKMGGAQVESKVEVPIRFQIEKIRVSS